MGDALATPRFTVYTPCRNSAATIHRVWESIRTQDLRDFEWLILDDGSEDDLERIVHAWARESDVPIRLLRLTSNIGHAASLNLAVKEARGQFFLKADSDDSFVPHALRTFLEAWNDIPTSDRAGFAGVTGCCMDALGRRIERPFPVSPLDSTPAELYFVHGFRQEKWGFTRTDLLRLHPFPTLDRYVPESVVWRTIGQTHRTRYINDLLREYRQDNPHSLSSERIVRFPRGMCYHYAVTLSQDWQYFWRDPVGFARILFNYARHAKHAGIRWQQAKRHVPGSMARASLAMAWPAGLIYGKLEEKQGKVARSVVLGDWDDAP